MELLHFEDLSLGGRWTTRGRTLTETDLVNHAGTAGDWGPLHIDQELAGASHFGTRVAHGSLLISIAMGLGAMDVPQPATVGLVGTGWRFMRPVRAGDTIRAHFRLSRKRDVDEPRWGLVAWRIEITNQRQEIVAEGEATVLVARRQVPQVSIPAPAAKRRRRGRRGSQSPVPVISAGPPPPEANLPEPAPVDTPAPRSRRPAARKVPDDPAQVVPSAPAPPDEVPVTPSASARRRRRRRGGSGGSGATGGVPEEILPVPPTAEHRVYTPGAELVPAEALASPGAVAGGPTDDGNPIGQILKRFRRPRSASRRAATPEAPGPGDTR